MLDSTTSSATLYGYYILRSTYYIVRSTDICIFYRLAFKNMATILYHCIIQLSENIGKIPYNFSARVNLQHKKPTGREV